MQNANNSVSQNNYVESANFAKDCAPSICTVDIIYIYIKPNFFQEHSTKIQEFKSRMMNYKTKILVRWSSVVFKEAIPCDIFD